MSPRAEDFASGNAQAVVRFGIDTCQLIGCDDCGGLIQSLNIHSVSSLAFQSLDASLEQAELNAVAGGR